MMSMIFGPAESIRAGTIMQSDLLSGTINECDTCSRSQLKI